MEDVLIEEQKSLSLIPVDKSVSLFFKFFILFLLVGFSTLSVHSQTDSTSAPTLQSIDYGFKKLANTITFFCNGLVNVNTSFGDFAISQQYSGTGIRVITTAFRDDQNLVLRYSKELLPNLKTIAKHSWLLSSDSRSIELNKLERNTTMAGLEFTPIRQWTTSVLAGYERNNQLGIVANALAFEGSSSLQPIKLDEYSVYGGIRTEYLQLDTNRINSDFTVDIVSDRDFFNGNTARFFSRFRRLQRDFFTPVGTGFQDLIVETRVENRFSLGTDLQLQLGEYVGSQFQLSVDQAAIPRGFRSSISLVPQTSIIRTLDELQLSAQGSLQYSYKDYRQNVWLQYVSRKEENQVSVAFPLLPVEETELRRSEFNRDNSTSRLRIGTDIISKIFAEDTLQFSTSLGILRYDTPSELNRDDRDEQTLIGTLLYGKRINDVTAIQYYLSGQSTHLVYLKKERSSLNNVNSILKMGTNFFVNASKFSTITSLELLANYTVYDFEIPEQIRSFSFRQVLFRDSTTFAISSKHYFELRAYIRYFERGRLYWDTFSELPELQSLETFFRVLFYASVSKECKLGIGSRFYSMQQKNLLLRNAISSDISQTVPGPEVDIRYVFSENSFISLTGWYEFQRSSGIVTRELPNVSLLSRISF